MKSNYKIIVQILFAAAMILWLISRFIVRDLQVKSMLLNISLVILCATFLQMVLFQVLPGLFKQKPGKDIM